ncbi:4-aminobutyrate--2-oxoglutarate transaminase [Limnochorda pilosa]|uniref:(S)-3-amino-2-methylpropionate transaminase n=1 Tax=Limnochorda pilosa TaxID=1555112 RepID=A0A0K2SLP5_LIMPI|nr:4-aminobutyrate--2-oxoglutarate transaminase [Limnochorda pilosa]BAS27932.1 4-aminobutyrate aminotransferase [Limnochorda pilosa]
MATNSELNELRRRYVPRGVFGTVDAFMDRGHGATVEDVDGRLYIDFAGGIGVLNVGHTPDPVVRAVVDQASRYLHSCMHVMWNEPYVQVARRLAELAPGAGPKKTLLLNSGAEAVENAVKIARAATGRPAVVAFAHAFHGRTLLGMTLTAKASPYKLGFGPLAPEVYRAPFPYLYRRPPELTEEAYVDEVYRAFEERVVREIGTERVAAVILEPVLGEGGFLPTPPAFAQRVARFCREHGIVFIADEVQTGMGRTGTLLASEQLGIEPDLITLAKSLAAGLPLGAVVGRAELMDAPQVGGLGGTFAGNPVACSAALAVLDMVTAPGFLERARRLGDLARERLVAFQRENPLIGDVRGLGPMLAMELVRSPSTREPDEGATAAVLAAAHRRGLILMKAGTYNNVIRLLFPLVITDEELEEGLRILSQALARVDRQGAGTRQYASS